MYKQIKRDIYLIHGDTYFKNNFAIISHNRLSFENCIVNLNIYKNNRIVNNLELTTTIEDAKLIISIDKTVINLPIDTYYWNLHIEFTNGEKYTWLGGQLIVLSNIPNNHLKLSETDSINSYEITEINETINIEVNDGSIQEPDKTGLSYGRKWNGSEFIWDIVTTETGIGTVTSVGISGNEFIITGSPIIGNGIINIEINEIEQSKIIGLTSNLNSKAELSTVLDHTGDTNNPHLVIKKQLGNFEHYVLIGNVSNIVYPIFPTIPYAITINSIIVKTVSGSCTGTLRINNNTILNLASFTINNVQSTITATGNNITEINDTINLEIVNNNGGINLSLVIIYSIN